MNWLPLGRKQYRAIKESRIFRDKVNIVTTKCNKQYNQGNALWNRGAPRILLSES